MIDETMLAEQMKNTRHRDGRWERLVDGEWVEWPLLKLDKWANDETKRVVARHREKEASRGIVAR